MKGMARGVTIFAATLVFFFAAGATKAWADLDHLCLNQCVANGGQGGACLLQCAYVPEASQNPSASPEQIPSQMPTQISGQNSGQNSVQVQGQAQPGDALSPHNVFNAPVPVDGQVIMPVAPPPAPPPPDVDYACLKQCLHDGQTYDLCKQNCVIPDCPPSAVECSSGSAGVGVGSAVPGAAGNGG